MLVLEDASGAAGHLASDLHGRLEELGVYEREARPWLPHITVLRFRARPSLRPSLPGIPPISPSEAAVYHSLLAPDGARYEVLESVRLGSSAMVV
jgi:2'-5' RNA ligase